MEAASVIWKPIFHHTCSFLVFYFKASLIIFQAFSITVTISLGSISAIALLVFFFDIKTWVTPDKSPSAVLVSSHEKRGNLDLCRPAFCGFSHCPIYTGRQRRGPRRYAVFASIFYYWSDPSRVRTNMCQGYQMHNQRHLSLLDPWHRLKLCENLRKSRISADNAFYLCLARFYMNRFPYSG